MFSRGALAAFAVILAEFVVLGLVIRAVGFLFVVLASLAAALVGTLIVRRQIPALVSSGRDFVSSFGFTDDGTSPLDSDATTDRALLIGAGVLLMLPGLLTGIIGAVLLLPPIRTLAGGFARRRLVRFVPSGLGMPFIYGRNVQRRGSSRADVVDVDVVSDDTPQPAPPELN